MVSDQDIATGVETLLRQSDPNSLTSLNDVVQQLEAKLGLDLSDKAGFIRDQINLLLRAHPNTTPAATQPPPPPPQQPQYQAAQLLHFGPKDHFALHNAPPQYHTQPQQILHHFAFQPHHSYDLNFQQPPPPLHPVHAPQLARQHPTAQQSNIAAVSHQQSPKESASVGTKRRGGPGGLNKVCGVSPELQVIVGEPALPRTEIVKQLWAYIRKHNLQDPSNKRKIICDDALRIVFETDCTDMFKMNKLLAKHILPLEQKKESSQAKRTKVDVESTTETTSAPVSSTFTISEALAKFFGTGEKEMLDKEVLERVWEYVKLNRLEDPVNPMVIQCDEKLSELLGCESISAVGINEMLRRHLFKPSS